MSFVFLRALVAALQAMGYSRPNGKPTGDKRPREPYPSEPCLICTKEGHKRENCKKAAHRSRFGRLSAGAPRLHKSCRLASAAE